MISRAPERRFSCFSIAFSLPQFRTMISDRKSMQQRPQNRADMRPKWLTKLLLGALGPPLLHQGRSKGRRRSKIDRSGPKIDRNYLKCFAQSAGPMLLEPCGLFCVLCLFCLSSVSLPVNNPQGSRSIRPADCAKHLN